MAAFDELSGEKVAYGMPIDMQKECFKFETMCRRNNFSEGLLVACCRCHTVIFSFYHLCYYAFMCKE